MKVILKEDLLILVPETEADRAGLGAWKAGRAGHVLFVNDNPGPGLSLVDLGAKEHACNEPINVVSSSPDPTVRLISNFAHTPFELDGRQYGSVEAFWQGLKFPEEARRREIAPLHGEPARRAGFDAPESAAIEYRGRPVRVGTADHWRLMAFACWAKFNQHEAARQALLGTGERPLIHKTRRDSRNIPGVVMADVWMKVRRGLVKPAS